MLIESHEEHHVEEILCARTKVKGRGKTREVLVKWTGYHDPTWEPLDELIDNEAMDKFESKYGDLRDHDGPREIWENKRKTGPRAKNDGPRRKR